MSSNEEGDWHYRDLASGEEVYVAGRIDPAGAQLHYALFGSDEGEALAGAGASDRLYGGGGNDTLEGAGGRDYLDGNGEDDTLRGGARKTASMAAGIMGREARLPVFRAWT